MRRIRVLYPCRSQKVKVQTPKQYDSREPRDIIVAAAGVFGTGSELRRFVRESGPGRKRLPLSRGRLFERFFFIRHEYYYCFDKTYTYLTTRTKIKKKQKNRKRTNNRCMMSYYNIFFITLYAIMANRDLRFSMPLKKKICFKRNFRVTPRASNAFLFTKYTFMNSINFMRMTR